MMESSETELVISPTLSIPLSEIHFEFVRSSGPGGQNVNKVNSQAQLYWNFKESASVPGPVKERLQLREGNRINRQGILRIDCQTSRDREKNKQECLNRLRGLIVQALNPPKKRKKTKTPRWVKEKRLRNKKEKSKIKRLRRPPSMND